jgi:hypothetical protein
MDVSVPLTRGIKIEVDLPLDFRGTVFQQRWAAFGEIPVGTTAT